MRDLDQRMIAGSDAPLPADEPSYDGPERRDPARADRRKTWRGGRRATDAIARLADFLYRLLTEPPR